MPIKRYKIEYKNDEPDYSIKMIQSDKAEFKIENNDDGSLTISGWASRIEPDRGDDIVLPEAFTNKVLNKYKKKPIVLFNHRFYDLPIGKTLSTKRVDGEGLYVKIIIYPTNDRGADTILLIKNDVINSFSFGFMVKKYEFDEETQIRTITELDELIEISVVNLGMNEDAIMDKAQELQLELKSFKPENFNINKGRNKMDPEEIKKLKEKVDGQDAEVKKASATIGEVQKQVDDLITLTKSIKDVSANTDGEIKELIEKVQDDLKEKTTALDDAIKDAAKRNKSYGPSANASAFTTKMIMDMKPDRMERLFTRGKCEEIEQLKYIGMQAGVVDWLACELNADYKAQPVAERTKDWSIYREFQMKAMDTTTTNEGLEYVPSAVYTSNFWPLVQEQLVVGNMHPSFPMRAQTQTDLVEGDNILALRGTEKKTIVSAHNTTEQTPGSANITWNAEKLWTRVQFSAEFDDDSLIAAANYIISKSSLGIGQAFEKAVINGDDAGGSGYDTGDVPGATDARYAWNGHRGLVQAGAKKDLGTFDSENISGLRALGGKYFAKPNDFFWYTSIELYLRHLLNPTELPEVVTMDKYGAMATIVTGELAKIFGAAILTSEFVLNTYNAAGIYDGVTTNKGILVGAHRDSMKTGIWKSLQIKMNEDIIDDVFNIVARTRLDFQPIFDATSETLVVIGHNINMT